MELALDPCPASGSLGKAGGANSSQSLVMFCLWVPDSRWFGHLLDSLSKCHTFQGGHLGTQTELLLAKFSIKWGCPKWRLVLSSFLGNPRMD